MSKQKMQRYFKRLLLDWKKNIDRKNNIKMESYLQRRTFWKKKKNIRLNCCKVQQRCVLDGPVYKCENTKKSKCWWRGAIRGDVWIQDQNGEWTEVNAIGSFRYLDDKENGLKVDTQFTQLGHGSVTSSIIVTARGKVIKSNKGLISINGKTLPKTKTGLVIRFIGNNIKISHIKRHKFTTIIKGLTEERMGFIYDPSTKTCELNVVSEENSKGLFVDPQNPAKYQLTKEKIKI